MRTLARPDQLRAHAAKKTTSVRRAGTDADGTTEAAALTVIGLGVASGTGSIAFAAGASALVFLMMREKQRLHQLVRQLAESELRAGLQFAVLAVLALEAKQDNAIRGTSA